MNGWILAIIIFAIIIVLCLIYRPRNNNNTEITGEIVGIRSDRPTSKSFSDSERLMPVFVSIKTAEKVYEVESKPGKFELSLGLKGTFAISEKNKLVKFIKQ